MQIQIFKPKNREEWLALRRKFITSTEYPALRDLSPYMTRFELWHNKKNQTDSDFSENERTVWGTRLQDAIALGFAEERGLTVRRVDEFKALGNCGSSFDFEVVGGDEANIEIKNVDSLQFKNGWIEDSDGNLEAPPHIELQIQHQMLVSGKKKTYLCALVGGNRLQVIERDYLPEVGQMIQADVDSFLKSVQENRPPEPDFKNDIAFFSKLYGYSEPGKVLDARQDARLQGIAELDKQAQQQIKELEAVRAECKGKMLQIVGDAEKVIGNGFSISAGIVAPTLVEAFERKGYRAWRINWKKQA